MPPLSHPSHQPSKLSFTRCRKLAYRPLLWRKTIAQLIGILSVVGICFIVASQVDSQIQEDGGDHLQEQNGLDPLAVALSGLALGSAGFFWWRSTQLKRANSSLLTIQKDLQAKVKQYKHNLKAERLTQEQLKENISVHHQRIQQVYKLRQMNDLLLSAQHMAEVILIAAKFMPQIVPSSSGILYELRQNFLYPTKSWGSLEVESATTFAMSHCWALRRGRLCCENYVSPHTQEKLCSHHHEHGWEICAPIMTPNGPWGLLYFQLDSITEDFDPHLQDLNADEVELLSLIQTVSDNLGLYFYNLSLRYQLTIESYRDPLTTILNRRGLAHALQNIHLTRTKQFLSILLLDIDRFKQLNDTYGHDAGDAALLGLVKVVNECTRETDIFCRYGGEEFLLVLPGIQHQAALVRAEALRGRIADKVFRYQNQCLNAVTVSIGVSTYPDHASNFASLMQGADAAVYQAKVLGRNQVVSAASCPKTSSVCDITITDLLKNDDLTIPPSLRPHVQ